MVLISHGHYTVDVIIAYYVTTQLWYIYHTMANNAQLKVIFLFLPIFTNPSRILSLINFYPSSKEDHIIS